jgi:predicted nucleotidyltransferase
MPKRKVLLYALVHQLRERLGNELLDVVLFGSKARGDSGPWSDIDILITVG